MLCCPITVDIEQATLQTSWTMRTGDIGDGIGTLTAVALAGRCTGSQQRVVETEWLWWRVADHGERARIARAARVADPGTRASIVALARTSD